MQVIAVQRCFEMEWTNDSYLHAKHMPRNIQILISILLSAAFELTKNIFLFDRRPYIPLIDTCYTLNYDIISRETCDKNLKKNLEVRMPK